MKPPERVLFVGRGNEAATQIPSSLPPPGNVPDTGRIVRMKTCSLSVFYGLGRAIGETMIVLMASGNASLLTASLFDSTRTLAATIAAELGEVVFGEPHYNTLFFIGTLLFSLTFAVNLGAHVMVGRLKRKLAGKL